MYMLNCLFFCDFPINAFVNHSKKNNNMCNREALTDAGIFICIFLWFGLRVPSCRFVLSAVSPAVVVPSMLLLQKDGYGVEKGIPTLLMAAGSFDDILAITGFSTCLGMAFSTGTAAVGVWTYL